MLQNAESQTQLTYTTEAAHIGQLVHAALTMTMLIMYVVMIGTICE